MFGAPSNGPASVALAETVIDYWVSFATSLTPNDGKGNATREDQCQAFLVGGLLD